MAWTIPRIWQGETAAILASGPSMSAAVADAVRGRARVVAVSNQGIPTRTTDGRVLPALAPWADVMYAADLIWWAHNRAAALAFAGTKLTIEGGDPKRAHFRHPQVYPLQNGGVHGFDDRPDHLRTGRNSGYQAMHVAAHFGATTILLCGFDMRKPEGEAAHWFGEHAFRPNYESPYPLFLREFVRGVPEFEARGIRIINCTPDSALTCVPFQPLEDCLREADERRQAARLRHMREGPGVHAVSGTPAT